MHREQDDECEVAWGRYRLETRIRTTSASRIAHGASANLPCRGALESKEGSFFRVERSRSSLLRLWVRKKEGSETVKEARRDGNVLHSPHYHHVLNLSLLKGNTLFLEKPVVLSCQPLVFFKFSIMLRDSLLVWLITQPGLR